MLDIKTNHPITVLFHAQNEEESKALFNRYFDSLANGSEVDGARVTAISLKDEFERVELCEEEMHGV